MSFKNLPSAKSNVEATDFNFQPILLKQIYTRQKKSLHLVSLPSSDQLFVLKLYPFNDDKPSPHFLNEMRFANLNHPNIITIYHHKEREEALIGGLCSYTLMEYAPFGDFHTFLTTTGIEFEEKLARTYFRHLIEGLEYLHSRGIAHLDLKPKNLLIGNNYQLKITDFDLSFKEGDSKHKSKGSFSFRAPELLYDGAPDPKKCDIFSVGMILFVLRTAGRCPHQENIIYEGHNLSEIMHTDSKKFWNIHLKAMGKQPDFFSEEFKELFNRTIVIKPQERPSIEEIKQSAWYCGPVFANDELASAMKELLSSRS